MASTLAAVANATRSSTAAGANIRMSAAATRTAVARANASISMDQRCRVANATAIWAGSDRDVTRVSDAIDTSLRLAADLLVVLSFVPQSRA